MRTRRTAVMAMVAAVLALATGCETPLTGEPDTTPSSGSETSAGPTERPTALPTDIRECTDDRGEGARVPPLAGWDVQEPPGFVESTRNYSQFAPIEGDFEPRYFDLDPSGFPDVIGFAFYPSLAQGLVTDECGRLIEKDALARLELQLEEAGETMLADPEPVDLAGVVAYEVLAEAAAGYMVRNYFAYGIDELLHIECQWVEHETEVAQGCEAVLASLTW